MRTSLAAAAVVLSVWGAPAASAQTVVVPEGPGTPGVSFVDNPAIVDPHPAQPQTFSRVPGDRAIALHFTTGTPECFGVHATVTEAPQTVTVDLRQGTLPEAVGRPCILIAMSGTLEVPLEHPLGGRAVLALA